MTVATLLNSTEVQVLERAQRDISRPLSATEIQAGVNLIQQVMRGVMQKDVHYGTIPGTPKPTLYKPGAEKLLFTFHISTEPSSIEDLSTSDEIRYRVTIAAKSQSTGVFLGAATGECSSSEAKYKWRAPVCNQEFDETAVDRRRELWKKGYDGKAPYKQKQIRTEPADVANTILKMAHKRGLIAVTLVVTAASDIFAQDIEDLPEGLREEIAHEEGHSAPVITEPRPALKSEPVIEQTGSAPATETPGIRVRSVRVAKTGTSDKGDWRLFVITLSDGAEYTTFSETLGAGAKVLLAKNAAVTFEFEEKNGKRNLILLEEVQ